MGKILLKKMFQEDNSDNRYKIYIENSIKKQKVYNEQSNYKTTK